MSTNGGGSIYPGGGGTGEDPQGTGSDTDGETDTGDDGTDSGGDQVYPGGGGTGDDPQGTGSDTDDGGTDTGGDGGDQVYPGGGGTGEDPQGTGSDTDGETDTGDDGTDSGGDQVYPGGGGTGDDPQGTGSDTDGEATNRDLGSIDPSQVQDPTARTRLLAAQRQAEDGTFNPDNPYTPTGDTSGLGRLTGGNLEAGEDYTVTGEGGDFGLRATDQLLRQAAADQATAANRTNPFGSGGQSPQQTGRDFDPSDFEIVGGDPQLTDEARSDIEAEQLATARSDLERQIERQTGQDVEAGEDFVVQREGGEFTVEYTNQFIQEQAERDIEAERGIEAGEDFTVDVGAYDPIYPGGEGTVDSPQSYPDTREPDIDVEWTESYLDELQAGQEETDPESMGLVEANLAGVDLILGPPGQLESGIRGTVEGAAQPVIGAPGDVEQQTLGTITGPQGQLERDIGGVLEGAAQPVLGPKGQFERDAGSAAFDVADVSGEWAQIAREDYINPLAEVTGDLAGLGQQSLRTVSPTTYLLGGDPEEEVQQLETAARDVFRGEDEGEESLTETATQGVVGGGLGLGAELTVGAPNVAVQLGDATFGAAGAVGENLSEEGIVGGTQATAATAGTVGAVIAAGEARNIITNPFRATGEILAGGAIARGAERVTTAARARAETRGQDSFDLEDVGSQQGREGQVDRFQTGQGEPDALAVREIEQRATQQPETVQEALDEPVLWRSDPTRGDFTDVGEGASELPGLFVTPDEPTLRLDTDIGTSGTTSSGSLTPRIPFIGGATRPQRMAGFEGTDIRAMPSSAAESAYAVYREGEPVETGLSRRQARGIVSDAGGEMRPDPTTAGYDFLLDDAQAGTAYTRAAPDRSPELEAVYPPGTEFERVGTAGPVSIPGGRPGTADLYRRADADADTGTTVDDVDVDDVDGETFTAEEISRRTSQTGPEGQPVVPPTTAPTSTDPVVSDSDITTGSVFDDTSTTTDISDTDVSATTGATDPVSGLSSGTATGTTASTTTGTGTGSATSGTSPTSTGPTTPSPPSASPTETTPTPIGPTSGGPTSTGPPSLGPPTTGGPTTGVPPATPPPQTPPPRLPGDDDDEELRRLLDSDVDEFGREFEYGVVSPEEVLKGDDIGV